MFNPMKHLSAVFILLAFSACKKQDKEASEPPKPVEDNRAVNFPIVREKVGEFPQKEKLWIFLLAGQSNMAGRGLVEPQDTISHERIISLGENMEWYYAKEPLHFYEPDRTGLDCGVSFASELLNHIPDDVTIGLVPCAVGGSAISQWNNDEMYRGVKLLTNFTERAEAAQRQGIIKGVLWHQGESDAHSDKIPKYKEEVEKLFSRFRQITENESLPIFVGELGSFMTPENQPMCDSINAIIHQSAGTDKYRFVISTKDLEHRGDSLHFNSAAQREMGARFAKTYAREMLQSAENR